jgi:hypothetical protein
MPFTKLSTNYYNWQGKSKSVGGTVSLIERSTAVIQNLHYILLYEVSLCKSYSTNRTRKFIDQIFVNMMKGYYSVLNLMLLSQFH